MLLAAFRPCFHRTLLLVLDIAIALCVPLSVGASIAAEATHKASLRLENGEDVNLHFLHGDLTAALAAFHATSVE
ncbi:hypothetical protein P3T31_004179 [Rhizobium sp. AN70]|nr:hypothetical protein [Rhizobium sp. AN70]